MTLHPRPQQRPCLHEGDEGSRLRCTTAVPTRRFVGEYGLGTVMSSDVYDRALPLVSRLDNVHQPRHAEAQQHQRCRQQDPRRNVETSDCGLGLTVQPQPNRRRR